MIFKTKASCAALCSAGRTVSEAKRASHGLDEPGDPRRLLLNAASRSQRGSSFGTAARRLQLAYFNTPSATTTQKNSVDRRPLPVLPESGRSHSRLTNHEDASGHGADEEGDETQEFILSSLLKRRNDSTKRLKWHKT